MRRLEAALAQSGLCLRGVVSPQAVPNAPGTGLRLANGEPVSGICLVGHKGGGFWPLFEAWHKAHPGIADPLDNWSKSVIRPVADLVGGEAVFPSDRPWKPFQQWAMAAEGLKPSPLGLLIHPQYGLWHGYRGAILFGGRAVMEQGQLVAEMPDGMPDEQSRHPCDNCVDKPCLSACPVGAFTAGGFAVADCRAYLKSGDGVRGCMQTGCRARDACPVGREHRYSPDQIRFHMTAFG